MNVSHWESLEEGFLMFLNSHDDSSISFYCILYWLKSVSIFYQKAESCVTQIEDVYFVDM